MHFGHYGHTSSDRDLTIFKCQHCGWVSGEMTLGERAKLGAPWSCYGTCGRSGVTFVIFHPDERAKARAIFLGE
jgi:hypothetical protein